MLLSQLLALPRGVIAVTGSGGKTSLLRRLAAELDGTVLLTTSTHIFPFDGVPLLLAPAADTLRAAFSASRVLCAGIPEPGSGKLTALPYPLAGLSDYVLCEADGSHGLPLKAHLPHEPAIPEDAVRTVQVVGLSGLGQPIRDAAHRSAQYAMLCSAEEDERVTPELAAAVLRQEAQPDIYYLNQAERRLDDARRLAALLPRPCIAGSLQEEWFLCLS